MNVEAKNTNTRQWLEYHSSTRSVPTGWTYNSIQQFVLLHGRPFEKATMPRKIRMGGIGQCFRNSIKLAQKEGFIYCEGYARCSATSFATLHAWCVDVNGNVHDSTWPNGFDYYGVAIALDYAIERRRTSSWQSVLDSPPDFPVINGRTTDWRYKGTVGGMDSQQMAGVGMTEVASGLKSNGGS